VFPFLIFCRPKEEDEEAGWCRDVPAGGQCAGDIDRNIKVSFSENKGKQPLCAFNATINISAIFRHFVFFFKIADELSQFYCWFAA
jgi:hypothetical protein